MNRRLARISLQRRFASQAGKKPKHRDDNKLAEGLDFDNFPQTLKNYLLRDAKGRELRDLHRNAARQYQNIYGYSLASFFGIAGFAYILGQMKRGKDDAKSDTKSDNVESPSKQ